MTLPLHKHDADVSLVHAIRDRDEQALAQFIARNDRWVRGVVFSVLGKADGVDDVAQAVWLSVWERAATLAAVDKWRTWLYRLAWNKSLDARRRGAVRRKVWESLVRLMRPGDIADHRDPSVHLTTGEQHAKVLRALWGLPQIYRQPFMLRHLEDWSYLRIAEVLDLPVDTVETRLVRARRMLREALADGDA